MLVIALVLTTLPSSSAPAPQDFVHGWFPAESNGAVDTKMTDLDGDGDPDLLAAGGFGGDVAWFEKVDGILAFGPKRIIDNTIITSSTVEAVDLDGDGDRDVVVANSSIVKFAWFENDGGGGFGPLQLVASPLNSPSDLVSGDLDGDGDADLAGVQFSSKRIFWYANDDGLGDFGSEQVIDLPAGFPNSLLEVDVDQDGDLDLAVPMDGVDQVVWYPNDGTGTFGAPVLVSSTAEGAMSLDAADLDADGDLDLLCSDFDSGEVSWYPGLDGAGAFGPEVIVASGLGGSFSVDAVDLEGDGDFDLLYTGYGLDEVAWHANDGTGTFSPKAIISPNALSAFDAYGSDIDGDGDQDVVATFLGSSKACWFENRDGTDAFGAMRLLVNEADAVKSLAASDVDGDGDQDLFYASWSDSTVAWFENLDGEGTTTQRMISNGETWARHVVPADLDGDGDPDLAAYIDGDTTVRWYRNADGLGDYTPANVLQELPGFTTADLKAADLDGDGDLDLLTPDGRFENLDGQGLFGPRIPLPTEGLATAGADAADFDGDGDLDLLVSTDAASEINWFENLDGAATYGPARGVASGAGIGGLVEGVDLDGDGDPDVVHAARLQSVLTRHENTDGLGSFGPVVPIPGDVTAATALAPVDLDGDGDQDLMTASQDGAAWHENLDGQGTFGGVNFLWTGISTAIEPMGANGDGRMDVAFGYAPPFSGDVVELVIQVPCGGALASAETVRLGTPPNPAVLLPGATSGPVVGATWDPRVDHSAFLPGALLDVLGVTLLPLNLPVAPYGTILCDVFSFPPYTFQAAPGVAFVVAIPDDCSLVGASLSSQALSTDGVALLVTNALDITIGTF